MYRFLLKPKWLLFHLLCAVVIVAMVWAAFWQLRRLHQHNAFKSEVQRRTAQPIAPFTTTITKGTPDDLEWLRVTATGTYVQGKSFEIVNVEQNGSSGHDAVGGLQLVDGTVLLVNRGFVVGDAALPVLPSGQVTITGRIRRTQKAGIGQTADDGSKQLTQVRRMDLGALSKQFTQKTQAVYLDELASDPAEPADVQPVVFPDLDNGPPHLSYTVQWFIFSVCVAVGWVLAVRRSVQTRAGTRKKKPPKVPPIADEFR